MAQDFPEVGCDFLPPNSEGNNFSLMGPIEEALREKFFPALFRGEEIDTDFPENPGP